MSVVSRRQSPSPRTPLHEPIVHEASVPNRRFGPLGFAVNGLRASGVRTAAGSPVLTVGAWCGFVWLFGCWVIAGVVQADQSAPPEDAALRAVSFIDADRGWAVGDLGTILQTIDGGASWRPLPSGTTAHLDAVGMFNSQRGVALGGHYQPHTQIGVGDVLWTADGGNSWLPTETADLPPLRHLVMGLGGRCVAAGDWSPVYQTSVFVSQNGGQSWQPSSGTVDDPVIGLAGSVDDLLALTDRGELLRLRQDQVAVSLLPPAAGRLSVATHQQLVWVAQAATEQLTSVDFGTSWQAVAGDPQLPVAGQSVLYGEGRWTLGHASPRLYRGDRLTAGHQPTVISDVPMHSLFRLDSDRGWAVGDWGTIALTRDGGQTWRVVRGGNRAAAVMVVAATGRSLPWSLLAVESLQNRRRVAIVTRHHEPLTRDAAGQLGATAIYCAGQPLPSDTDSVMPRRSWPQPSFAGVSPQQLLSDTTPQVVVLGEGLTAAEKSAWTQAAIASGVVRVFETGRENGQTLAHAAALTHAGKLAGDVWDDALMLLQPGSLPPDRLRLTPRYDTANDRFSIDGLASFTGNHPRFVRPQAATPSRRHLQVLQARMGEAGWVAAVLQSPLPIDQLIDQVSDQLSRFSEENQQRLVYRLVVAAQTADKPVVYQGLLELAAARWPDQPLGRLSQLHWEAAADSQEWQAFRLGERYLAKNKAAAVAAQANLVQVSPFQTMTPTTAVSNAGLPHGGLWDDGNGSLTTIRLAAASESLPGGIAQPRWDAHPAVRQVSQSRRRDRETDTAATVPSRWKPEGRSGQVDINPPPSKSPPSSPAAPLPWHQQWRRLADGLLATAASSADGGTSVVAPAVQQRPVLDGRLDEPMWRMAHEYRLANGGTASLSIAHDADFVYFGIRGQSLLPPATTSAATTAAADHRGGQAPADRSRDQPLEGDDRYVLSIDVDGDLLTAYTLEFNAWGQTRDTYNGFSQWQPAWFLAHENQPEGVMVAEIAIKKSDLVGWQTGPLTRWNVSLTRPRPGSASSPFSLPQPEQWRPVSFE